MIESHHLIIAPLGDDHDRAGFYCGTTSLDNYLKKQARQDIKRRISRVFVAAQTAVPRKILGYYTLSSLSIELDLLPDAHARKLPRHPVPAALIGRLAVAQDSRGSGVGRMLLTDAVKRALSVSNEIAIYAMVVDAIDEQAEGFYQRFGFVPLSAKTRRLFLPLKSF
ncbi:MAG: GNAT family N-acetyltransferase [Halioglobus sp.]|nr:GNAT family N-acetyltransferase [Halioglobus sp.]